MATLIVIAEDISERKLAEEQLRSKTALLEAQVNSTLDGILVVDSEGNKILQNQRMIDLWHVPQEFADDLIDRRATRMGDPTGERSPAIYRENRISSSSRG